MPHIDDGTLHALLDGALPALAEAGALPPGGGPAEVAAHLRACADCRARLEAERGIREQAGEVLKDAGTIVAELPPFDALTPAAPRTVRRTWVSLAWAASVLLALGAGWSASVLWRSGAAEWPAIASQPELAPADVAADAKDGRDAAANAGSSPEAPHVETEAALAATTGTPDDTRREAVAAAAAEPQSRRADAGEQAFAPIVVEAQAPAPLARAAAAPAGQAARSTDTADATIVIAPTTFSAERVDAAPAAAEPAPVMLAMRQVDAGLLEWRPAAEEPTGVEPPLMLRDGSAPELHAAALLGATLVRAQQQLDGVGVDVYTWMPRALALESLVVTGAAPAREPVQRRRDQRVDAAAPTAPTAPTAPPPAPTVAPKTAVPQRAAGERQAPPIRAETGVAVVTPAVAAPMITTVVAESELSDGGRELVVYVPASGAYVVLRGDLPRAALAALARQLVPAY